MLDRDAILARHTALFNQGVRSGDFAPMLAHFTDDAELHFAGIPVGPFIGRAAIAAAYVARPPSDEIAILRARDDGDDLIVAYAWRAAPTSHAGDLILTLAADRITRLRIIYGPPEG